MSLALAFPLAAALRQIGHGADLRLLALALTASSLGVMVPVLRDAAEIDTDFGQVVVMAGSVGEFAALLLLTVLFSADPEPTWAQVAYVVALGVAALLGALGLRRLWRAPWLRRALLATDQSTSQLRVRGAFVILLAFAGLAHVFGVDALLGAFVAGVVLNVADSDDRPTQERYIGKLLAIGYGFLVPVFFVVTGVQFDVRSLVASESSLVLLPALLAAILIARAVPALLYRRRLGTRPAVAAGLLQATTLTFPVAVAEVGRSLELLTPATSAALVGAALLSVLLFPAAALALRPWSPHATGPTVPPAGPGPVTARAATASGRRDAAERRGGLPGYRKMGLMGRTLVIVVGVVITIAGVVFAVQGLGYLHGSVMTGTTLWAVLGPVIAVCGLGVVALGLRASRR